MRAQWRSPALKARRHATRASATEGVGAAMSAWIAEERNRASGQELTRGGEKSRWGPVSAARERELNHLKEFKVRQPLTGRAPSTSMVDGKKDLKVRLVAKGQQGPDLQVRTPPGA